MSPAPAALSDKSRLAVLLEHFATIDDPPTAEMLAPASSAGRPTMI